MIATILYLMNEVVMLKIEELRAMTPLKMIDHESVRQKFIEIHDQVAGKGRGAGFYAEQAYHFKRLLMDKTELDGCSTLSFYGCFLDLAVTGLSCDQSGRPMLYLTSRNVKIGTDQNGNPAYEKRAQNVISPYGELYQRQRVGQIKYADNPVIVYDCDLPNFEIWLDDNGQKMIKYKPTIPRTSETIVAGFIRIVRPDGSTDFKYMLRQDWERLAGFSSRQNSKYVQGKRVPGDANALYHSASGQIDPGFLEAKLIRHAFKTYPKLRTGAFTGLETEIQEQKEIEAANATIQQPENVNYGFEVNPETVQAEVVETANDTVVIKSNVNNNEGF